MMFTFTMWTVFFSCSFVQFASVCAKREKTDQADLKIFEEDLISEHLTEDQAQMTERLGVQSVSALRFAQSDLDHIFEAGSDSNEYWHPLRIPSCAGRWVHIDKTGSARTIGYQKPDSSACMKLDPNDGEAWKFQFDKADFGRNWERDLGMTDEPCKETAALQGQGLHLYKSKANYSLLIPTQKAVDEGVVYHCDTTKAPCQETENLAAGKVLLKASMWEGTQGSHGNAQWVGLPMAGWFKKRFISCASDETKKQMEEFMDTLSVSSE